MKSSSYDIAGLLQLPRVTPSPEQREAFDINHFALGDHVSHTPTGAHGILVGREGSRWVVYNTTTGATMAASSFVLEIEGRTRRGAHADRLRQIKRIHEAKKSR